MLRSGSLSQLRSLTLRSALRCDEVVQAAGKVVQLTDLHLAVPAASFSSLAVALSELRQLRQLTLRPPPAPAHLGKISAEHVPALRMVVVLGDPCRPLDPGLAAAVGELAGKPGTLRVDQRWIRI